MNGDGELVVMGQDEQLGRRCSRSVQHIGEPLVRRRGAVVQDLQWLRFLDGIESQLPAIACNLLRERIGVFQPRQADQPEAGHARRIWGEFKFKFGVMLRVAVADGDAKLDDG